MAIAAARAARRSAAARGAVPVFPVSRLLLVGGSLLAIAGLGGLNIALSSWAASTGYEIRRLEQERDALAAEVRLAEVEVASMAQADRIRQQATERLGMVPPESRIQVAVGVEAPSVVPLPARYVPIVEPVTTDDPPWWARALERLAGAH